MFHSFFHMFLRFLNLIHEKGLFSHGITRTLSKIDHIFVNQPVAEARDFHCNSHVFENLVIRSTLSDHAAVRLVIQKPTTRGQLEETLDDVQTYHFRLPSATASRRPQVLS